jgi:hypothetical protein
LKKTRIPIAIDRRVDKHDKPFNGKTANRSVADPYSTTGGRITVTASLRDDPLGRLHARRQIKEHQYAVGHYVQNLFELAASGRLQAMDPSKEPVDGRGAFVEPITDGQMRAGRRLQEARHTLGARGYALVKAVLADRLFLEQVAQASGISSRMAGNKFRECLDELADLFGFAGRAPSHRAPRDEHSQPAKHADNPKLHAAIRLARELKCQDGQPKPVLKEAA